MPITPIVTKTNVQAVIDQLVSLIERGEVKPGDRLPSERELSELFRVSRTCIREAFSALALLGVLEIKPGEGAYVGNLDVAPLMSTLAPLLLAGDGIERELLEFRRIVETEGARLAAVRRDPAAIDAMHKALDAMRGALQSGDGTAGNRADHEFHMAMLSGTGNRVLSLAAACTASLMSHSVAFNRERLMADPAAAARLLAQHTQMLEAISAGQAVQASQLAGSHLDQVLDTITERNRL